jgi:hypothetical protein
MGRGEKSKLPAITKTKKKRKIQSQIEFKSVQSAGNIFV